MLLRLIRLPALVLLLLLMAACAGTTTLDAPSAAGDLDIKITVDPMALQTGQKATLNYQFTNRATGKLVTDLLPIWGKPAHVIVADSQLTWFQHSYTEAPTRNLYSVQVLFGAPGVYNLWLEYGDEQGAVQIYHHKLSFGTTAQTGEENAAPLVESSTFEKNIYGVDVRLQTSALHAGQPAKFTYSFSQKGQPLKNLSPYLGAAGHLYSISADSEDFKHSSAEGSSPSSAGGEQPNPSLGVGAGETGGGAQPTSAATDQGASFQVGPEVSFEHEFEKPGLYKTWGQFLYQGVVIAADFVVRVNP